MEYQVGDVVTRSIGRYYQKKSIFNGKEFLPITSPIRFHLLGEVPKEIDPFKENIDPWTTWLKSKGYPEIKCFTSDLLPYLSTFKKFSHATYTFEHPTLGIITLTMERDISLENLEIFLKTHQKLLILDKVALDPIDYNSGSMSKILLIL
ncbi:Hypothetical protein HVR_LOCUS856 [uncultured virus]|nr:Hypothetical protein HVR_LOCUS856 [uncultured virus]